MHRRYAHRAVDGLSSCGFRCRIGLDYFLLYVLQRTRRRSSLSQSNSLAAKVIILDSSSTVSRCRCSLSVSRSRDCPHQELPFRFFEHLGATDAERPAGPAFVSMSSKMSQMAAKCPHTLVVSYNSTRSIGLPTETETSAVIYFAVVSKDPASPPAQIKSSAGGW